MRILEQSYSGNLGFEEMMRFYRVASDLQIAELERVIDREDWDTFRHLIYQVLGIQLESRRFKMDNMSKSQEFLSEVSEGMSPDVIMEKIEVVIKNDKPFILGRCKKYLESGKIDPEEFGDDYGLPSLLVCAALSEIVKLRMVSKEDKRIIDLLTRK